MSLVRVEGRVVRTKGLLTGKLLGVGEHHACGRTMQHITLSSGDSCVVVEVE